MWTHLSRIRGGIGLRGPVKTARNRPPDDPAEDSASPRQLLTVARHRETIRAAARKLVHARPGRLHQRRQIEPAALAHGRLRHLRRDGSSPRSTRHRRGRRGRRGARSGLPIPRIHPQAAHTWWPASAPPGGGAEATCAARDRASHAEWEEQAEVVEEVLASCGADTTGVIMVLTRSDLLPTRPASRRGSPAPPGGGVHHHHGTDGVDSVKSALGARARRVFPHRVVIPEVTAPAGCGYRAAKCSPASTRPKGGPHRAHGGAGGPAAEHHRGAA